MKDFIEIVEKRLAGIPCLYVRNTLFDTGSLVILYHGWGSKKENKRFTADLLARHGYSVIVPDAHLHGERESLPVHHSVEGYTHFWEVIFQSVDESGAFLDAIEKEQLAKRDQIAVVGSSMGGMTATAVFSQHPELKALVNFIGSGAWESSEQLILRQEGREPAKDEELFPIRKMDPMNHLNTFFPRPILLTGGEFDEVVPVEGQREFYESLFPHYQDSPDKLKLLIIPRSGHYVTETMLQEAVYWLKSHL